MEPTTSIHRQKRKRDESIALNNCIICQTGSSAGLRQSSSRGIESLKYAINVRLAHNCDCYIDAINRLQSGEVDLEKALWHKDCFLSFTSKERLERLKRHQASVRKNDEEIATRMQNSVDMLQWEKCIFCQAETGDSLHQVMNFEASAKVLNDSKNDTILSYRLAGVSDLVAAEAKYHLKCYVLFCRKRGKECGSHGRVETLFDPPSFSTVVKELETELNKGNVFSVRSVWDRYCQILTANGIASPALGSSNILGSFRNDLKACLGDAIEFVENISRKDSLLILPNLPRKTVQKNLVNISEDRDKRDTEGMLLKAFSSLDDSANLYRSLYHLSSRVKADIKEVKGCTEYDDIDQTQAESLIPKSLFVLVSMLLGENDDPDHHERILSIAQNIFVSSKGQKLMPKH